MDEDRVKVNSRQTKTRTNPDSTPQTDKSGHLTSPLVMSVAMLEICYPLEVLEGGVRQILTSDILTDKT